MDDIADEDRILARSRPADVQALEDARQAGLVYISDDVPGIRRKRAGTGFAYYWPDGRRITDPGERRRLDALAIPPAYTDVWISPDPCAHLQATGRDSRGRKQYRYHPDWEACRQEQKFHLLVPFARCLPLVRAQVDRDLRRRKPGYDKAVAAAVFLLDRLLIRVGNPEYAHDNSSYGLTTLTSRHVRIEGQRLRFRFRGKSGKIWNLDHSDRRIARAIRSLQELPGQHLFQYVDDEGLVHAVRSSDVNDYIRAASGDGFTSRQFRTWGGTALCAVVLAEKEPAASARQRTRTINAALDVVARQLGNTRAVSRRSYVHPLVFEAFETGALQKALRREPAEDVCSDSFLSEAERRVLDWLSRSGG